MWKSALRDARIILFDEAIYRIDNREGFAYDSYEQMMEETAGQAET